MKKDFIVRRSIMVIEGKPHVETYSEEELVRCKDCKHQVDRGRAYKDCDIHFLRARDDWFCADGERK